MIKRFTKVTLFPEEQRVIEDRIQSIEDLYVSGGINFEPMLRAAHDKMLADALARNTKRKWRNYYANNMSYNVHDALYELYEEHIGFDNEDRPYFRLSGNVRAYFKMLDKGFKPKSQQTGHVAELNNSQGSLFGETITNLYIGWRIRKDKYWDALRGLYLVEMDTPTSYKWVSDLTDISGRFGTQSISIAPVNPLLDDGIDIVPNTAKEAETKSGTE